MVAIVTAIQFVNILDFMMVMPLGPDFARGLSIDPAHLGLVAATYTVAGCLSGLLGAVVLDRFERRSALMVCLAGLGVGTVAASFAVDLGTLVLARVVAGLFGGPSTALALSVIADLIPEERRGRALGIVMGGFAIAAVAGVPAGLELARIGGWRLPFLAVGIAIMAIAVIVRFALPAGRRPGGGAMARFVFLRRPNTALALAAIACANMQAFLVLPATTAYLQLNLGFPREDMGLLYMIGGGLSLVGMRLAGRLVDRFGTAPINGAATLALAFLMFGAFVMVPPPLPLIVLFPLFMLAMSARNVGTQTLMSRVPSPTERAGFMSLASAVQHLAASAGAGVSSLLLTSDEAGRLTGMAGLAGLAILFAALVPLLQLAIERRLRRGITR